MIRKCFVFILALGAGGLCGCSGGWYRDSADRQIYRILAQRKRAVLDYQPDTRVATTNDPVVPKRAYKMGP